MTLTLKVLIAACFLVAGMLPAAPASAAPAGCGVDLDAPEIARAVRDLPPYPGTDWMWTPQSAFGNFDRCATLSTALVSVEGATGSSPITALMFHRGEYLGTATYEAYGFTSLNAARTTDDTVVLNYKTPGACNACPPAGITSVRYRWQRDHVEMLDPAPLS
jgi:hypothetical protein